MWKHKSRVGRWWYFLVLAPAQGSATAEQTWLLPELLRGDVA